MVGYHLPRSRSSYDLVSSGQEELEAHIEAHSLAFLFVHMPDRR